MKKILGFILCTLLVSASCFVVGADKYKDDSSAKPITSNMTDEWPMFQHDAQHTGYSSSNASNTGNIHWIYETTDSVYYSSPAVANNKVYIGCEAGYLYCIDAYTGDLIWNYETDDSYMKDSSPAVYQGNVYFTQRSNNVITCLDANNGSLVWEQSVGGRPAKSLTIANGRIYFGANTDKIYCWDAANGTTVWEYTTGGDVNSFPAVNNSQVYIGSADGTLYCLDADDGTEIWTYDTGSVVNSGPSVADGYVYFGSWSDYIYCVTEDSGTLVWSYLTDDRISSSPAIAYDKIYVTSSITLYCFNSSSGDFIWSYTPNIGIPASPAVADGKVYIGDCDYYFYCFDVDTGNIIWQKNLGWHFFVSSPAVFDGMVIVGNSDNKVYCFRDLNEPPDTPYNPEPEDGATDVDINANLSWECSDPEDDDLTYDVYFEADDPTPDILVSNNQSETTYDPGEMEYGTHYYWKIVAWDPYQCTEGPVWDFTTTSGPNDPPYPPSNPSPENSSSNIDIDADLSWNCSDPDPEDTLVFDVYLEANDETPDIKVADDITETTFNPGTLEYETVYYWQIIAKDSHGASTWGPVWHFTTELTPVPDLGCDGSLSWSDVKPGGTVEGNFTVSNIGEPLSLLNWQIESYPEWGIWSFNPQNGTDLAPEVDPVTVIVTVTAPDEKNSEFDGEVKIVNKENSSDFCTIDASLTTPKNKAFNFYVNILMWLFEKFPNAFPILKYMLGLWT